MAGRTRERGPTTPSSRGAVTPRWPRRRLRSSLLLLLAACLVVAASVAAGTAAVPARRATATVGILVRADPRLGEAAEQAPDRFVQDQLRLLLSPAGRDQQPDDDPCGRSTAVQAGLSDVVLVRTSAEDAASARRSALACVDGYRQARLATAQRRVDELQGRVAGELIIVRDRLAALDPGGSRLQRSGLAAEVGRLLARRNDLAIDGRTSGADLVPVVREVSVQSGPGARQRRLAVLLALCVGGCLALVLELARRRWELRADLLAEGEPEADRRSPAALVPR